MNKIKYLGWLYILYFFYALILPFLIGSIMIMMDYQVVEESGPAGGQQLLLWSGVPSYLVTFTGILALVLGFLIPIIYLIGGVLLLRLSNRGRKFLLASMSVSVISKILFIVLAVMYEQIKNIGEISYLSFIIFIIIEIGLIWLLSVRKVKQQFI